MSVNSKNRKFQYILGGIILVVIVTILTVKMGVFEPKEISIATSSKNNTQRVWFKGNVSDSDNPSITKNTDISDVLVIKGNKVTEYQVYSKLDKFIGKSNDDIIKIAKSRDKSIPLKALKEDVSSSKSNLNNARTESQDTFNKYGSLDKAYNNSMNYINNEIENSKKEYAGEKIRLGALAVDHTDFYEDEKSSLQKSYKDLKSGKYANIFAWKEGADINVAAAQRSLNSAKSQYKKSVKHLKNYKYKSPKTNNIVAYGIANEDKLTQERISTINDSFNSLVNGSIENNHYSGYIVEGSSSTLFTKMSNKNQKVVFDKPSDVKLTN